MLEITDSKQLLNYVKEECLLIELIRQINKDCELSNLNFYIKESEELELIIEALQKLILNLLEQNYEGYLRLIYRIDLAEKELLLIQKEAFEERIQRLAFSILKREYQKVWFRFRYKN